MNNILINYLFLFLFIYLFIRALGQLVPRNIGINIHDISQKSLRLVNEAKRDWITTGSKTNFYCSFFYFHLFSYYKYIYFNKIIIIIIIIIPYFIIIY